MTERGKICLQNIEDLSVLTMIPDNSKFNLRRMKKQFLILLVLNSTVYSQIKIDGGINNILNYLQYAINHKYQNLQQQRERGMTPSGFLVQNTKFLWKQK